MKRFKVLSLKVSNCSAAAHCKFCCFTCGYSFFNFPHIFCTWLEIQRCHSCILTSPLTFSSLTYLLALQALPISSSFFPKTIQSNKRYNFWTFWAIPRNSQQRNLPLNQDRNCSIFKHLKLKYNQLIAINTMILDKLGLPWCYFGFLWLQSMIRTEVSTRKTFTLLPFSAKEHFMQTKNKKT